MSNMMRRIELARLPAGIPVDEDFQLRGLPLPVITEGQVLCTTQYLSLDPYMRSQISGRHLSGEIGVGDTMRGETISQVLSSRDPGFAVGDLVRCFGGWCSHSVHRASELTLLPGDFPKPSLALSTLGMPGLTAWAGLHCLAKPKAGETVVIPAATGGVGSVAGQLARRAGCRVIGIAGSDDKCRTAVSELGYHHCINRRDSDLAAALDTHCPSGIDVYFDLVGGDMLNIASERLAQGARVLLCGLMADYNSESRSAGPPPGLWIRARATIFGLVVYDFESRREEFLREALTLYSQGALHSNEDISLGLETAPAAFCRLMRGENTGKVIIAVAEER
ncbi:alcohol dehydrogenase, zinc-containing [gamma proteobacterium NOR5-3]|nr:alcohol dehydrogenase, zinc-containing [gamma proteobacterium NOR5-3]